MPIRMIKTDISAFTTRLGNPCTLWADTQVCPYWKQWIKACIQKMSQGAIGVTNPSYMAAGLATCPHQGILPSLKLLTAQLGKILLKQLKACSDKPGKETLLYVA
jgi:hypothetical protein